ncbi:hypothetical protein [Paraburkholderia sp. UYCP14C]|uniref:hypothetical protein n=1 Tax=Paraburkholderia sp. UYCP14C TaxID=2511130 RepID=UPI0020070809|nr:hypothetical protein [Paraburkholderia sp. UYCP14C]
MQLIVRLDEMAPGEASIGELIAQHPILDDEPLLAHLRPDMSVDAFRSHALHALCLWPQWLLDDPLDRDALAASVRMSLFDDNARGWRAYVTGLRRDVGWFDAKAVKRRASRRVADAASPVQNDDEPAFDAPAGRAIATDVERDFGAAGNRGESVEGARRLDEGRTDEQRVAR